MKKTSFIIIHSLPDKKIKSLGNRALINIGNETVIDYQIAFCKKICKNSDIVVIGAFESKKLCKYLHKKYTNIKYISHGLTDFTNIGYSVQHALNNIAYNNLCLINGNIFIDVSSISKIKKQISYKENFIITTKQRKSSVGYIKNKDGTIGHCFFDLPQSMYDMIYIDSKYADTFNYNVLSKDMEKYYLFEIINDCIDHQIPFYGLDIDSRHLNIIENTETINKITRKNNKKYV